MLFAAAAIGPSALTNAGADMHTGILENRDATKKDARENGNAEREEQNRPVKADFVDTRQSVGCDGDENAQTCVSEPQTDSAAQESERHAFKKKFTCDAKRAGAESGADGQFLAAAFNAHQKQICHVCARDQKYQGDRAHEPPQR